MSFGNKSIHIVERLREYADLYESEYGDPGVVAMIREAADTIERLRAMIISSVIDPVCNEIMEKLK